MHKVLRGLRERGIELRSQQHSVIISLKKKPFAKRVPSVWSTIVIYSYVFFLPFFRNFRFEFVRLRIQPQISKAHDQIVLLQNSALYKFLNALQKIQRLDMLLTTLFLSPSGSIDLAMHDLYGASKLRVQLSRIRHHAARLCPKR